MATTNHNDEVRRVLDARHRVAAGETTEVQRRHMSIESPAINLPGVAREYFAAANSLDIDRTVALFAEEAVVTDEGQRIDGRGAIHEWVARTMREFAVTATPEHVDVHGGVVAVTALVTGRFPGCPVFLTFRFTLAGDRIAGLEIQ